MHTGREGAGGRGIHIVKLVFGVGHFGYGECCEEEECFLLGAVNDDMDCHCTS